MTFELHQPASGGEPVVRLNFKNGTDDATFTTYPMFGGQTDTPLSEFTSRLSVSHTRAYPIPCIILTFP